MFTDIVGSTRLWAEHEHVMPDELARHDALVTRSIGCGQRYGARQR